MSFEGAWEDPADGALTAYITFNPVLTDKDTHPVYVNIYRNGDTSTAVKSEYLGDYAVGTSFESILSDAGYLTSLDELYTPKQGATGFDWDGNWYHEISNWPQYSIGDGTVNGYTNLCAMVYDLENVTVYGVFDGDKDNAEVLYTANDVRDGTNLIEYLIAHVPNLDRDGYTHDEWFKWDAYGTGYKFSDTDTVVGWTNVFVEYTSLEQTVQVVIYRNGNMETPYATIPLESMNKGEVLNLTDLDISEYYTAPKFASRVIFEGWFNDGAWNQYKEGQDVQGLTEITINGWTNVIAMVWDEYPVNYHVLDGDEFDFA